MCMICVLTVCYACCMYHRDSVTSSQNTYTSRWCKQRTWQFRIWQWQEVWDIMTSLGVAAIGSPFSGKTAPGVRTTTTATTMRNTVFDTRSCTIVLIRFSSLDAHSAVQYDWCCLLSFSLSHTQCECVYRDGVFDVSHCGSSGVNVALPAGWLLRSSREILGDAQWSCATVAECCVCWWFLSVRRDRQQDCEYCYYTNYPSTLSLFRTNRLTSTVLINIDDSIHTTLNNISNVLLSSVVICFCDRHQCAVTIRLFVVLQRLVYHNTHNHGAPSS